MKTYVAAATGVIVVLMVLPAGLAAQDLWYSNDALQIGVTVHMRDYDCGLMETAWNPNPATGEDACIYHPDDIEVEGYGFCHFKILNEDESCILLNSRLDHKVVTDYRDVDMSVKIGEELTENSFTMWPSSDFYRVVLSQYWQEPGFALDSGRYVIQFTQQAGGCGGTADDGERTMYDTTLFICCDGRRGDVDYNGHFDIQDIDYLIDYLYRDGDEPQCLEEADANGNGQVELIDIDYLINYLFKGGPQPAQCPYDYHN